MNTQQERMDFIVVMCIAGLSAIATSAVVLTVVHFVSRCFS